MKIHCTIAVLVVSLFAQVLVSCRPAYEAIVVINLADSLLQANQVYADSLSLCQAVHDLRPMRCVRPTAYAKACFYYGRLLRLDSRYDEAMVYLLQARDARSGDHSLLGRVESNIAYICRLQGNYPLAYMVYSRSADQFALAADSLRYHTACLNMAYALAEQADTVAVLPIVAAALDSRDSTALRPMAHEVCAEAFLRAADYRTALAYISIMDSARARTPSVQMIKAQCFSATGQADSATCYAYQVLEQSSHPFLRVNALYILTQQDSTANIDQVRAAAAERAAILRQIAIDQGKLSLAVDGLQKHIHSSASPWRWGIHALVLFGVILLGLVLRSATIMVRKTHQLKQQNYQLANQLSQRKQLIAKEVDNTIAALLADDHWQETLHWRDYQQMCVTVNRLFYGLTDKLIYLSPLTEKEVRLCVLVLIDNFNSRQIAKLLHYSESGIRNFKQRTANKLGANSANFRQTLIQLLTGS